MDSSLRFPLLSYFVLFYNIGLLCKASFKECPSKNVLPNVVLKFYDSASKIQFISPVRLYPFLTELFLLVTLPFFHLQGLETFILFLMYSLPLSQCFWDLSGPKSCQVPVSCTSRPFPRSTTRALIAVLLVSYFDHCKNQLLRLCLWSIPLPIHLTWYHQINFLKCHFHFVNFHYKTQMLSDNQWKNARLSLAFQVQSYQNSLSPLYVISR